MRDSTSRFRWFNTILKSQLDNQVQDFVRATLGNDVFDGTLPPPISKNFGDYFHLDIWNEPAAFFANINGLPEDSFYVYPSTPYYQDFLQTWTETRQFLDNYFDNCAWCDNFGPNEEYYFKPSIVGPSFSGFHDYYLPKFYNDAKEAGVKPDYLSWHELSDYSLRTAEQNIIRMKSLVSPDGVKLSVNEWIQGGGEGIQFQLKQVNPAIAVRYFSILERQKVIGAKSCHSLPDDERSCVNSSLNALLTFPDSDEKRSIWWAFHRFNLFTGNFVQSKFSRPEAISLLDGVSSYDSNTKEGWALIGNYNSSRPQPLTITIAGLNSLGHPVSKIAVDLEIIENKNLEGYDSLKIISADKVYKAKNNQVVLPTVKLGFGDVAFLHYSASNEEIA